MRIEYYANGRKRRITVRGLSETPQPTGRPLAVMRALPAGPLTAGSRFSALEKKTVRVVPAEAGGPTVIPTETMSIGGTRATEVAWLRRQFGMEVVEEGSHAKVLLAAPHDADEPVRLVAQAATEVFERGRVESAQPNFLRLMDEPEPATTEATTQWGLDNDGHPGVPGADVAAEAAWTITRGDADVRVAVLDDGVDTSHPHLKAAVAAQRDFRAGDDLAAPEGDDAHGTACAGIIASRDEKVRGLAPGVGLIACRIGGRIGVGWLADDFQVADAIDWCWDAAGAAVLSNSWGGGPPSDLVLLAFERARTRGRGGKGSVVAVAAGNSQASSVLYPGDGPDILTVGASNQWDERKTRTSRDGERHWGSNRGKGLDLMAPGVRILTTDIAGAAGSSAGATTGRFNGTSAATPFAAAAAAMVLSVAPRLTEADVRDVLMATTDSMGPTGWDAGVGFGRLNVFNALRAARSR
jgi:thermitase